MKSIFSKIVEAIEATEFQKSTFKQKAIKLCESIFNTFCQQGGDFHIYRSFSSEFLKVSVIRNEDRTSILKTLKATGILLCDEKFNASSNKTGRAKGYKFNPELIKANGDFKVINPTPPAKPTGKSSNIFTTNLEDQEFKYSNSSIQFINNFNKSIQYYICFPSLELLVNKGFQRSTFDPKIYDFIANFQLQRDQILIDEEIKDPWITLKVDGDGQRYSLDTALKFAKSQNLHLIQYKDLCYIDEVDTFLQRKTSDLKIIYRKSIFDIENGLIRVSRNETNRRLDYNLTNMKSDLIDFIRLDGEELVEIDIANCQFSILNFLFEQNLDETFSNLCKSGKLYDYVAKKLNITASEAKEKMFRVAFDKVKLEQDPIRLLFPKTMAFIDGFKKKYGYKSLSILLQNIESSIMIDGILINLIQKDFLLFPIHDAFRVKKSQQEQIMKEIEAYFQSIKFECLPRIKSKKNKIKILYKGFKEVEIEEITKEDIQTFLNAVETLNREWYGATEELLINMALFEPYKTSYLYDKFLRKKAD
jgi:hypothetical protein